MSTISVSIKRLHDAGIEVLRRGISGSVNLPRATRIEAPSSLKWTEFQLSLDLGAFSYQVSGFCCAARIGRYCSFGEAVQVGRQNHPLSWISTSPAFYLHDRLFDLGNTFAGAADYHTYRITATKPPTRAQITTIGHDVWIGHGAYIAAGVTIGNGAMVAGHSVVAKDVPPYAVVAGNPAVVKKYRHPPQLIDQLQSSRWWRFAPWQFAHLDPAKPEEFLQGIDDMQDVAEFNPSIMDLREISP